MQYFKSFNVLITVLFFSDIFGTEEDDIVLTVELDCAPRKQEKLVEYNSSDPEELDVEQELESIDSLMKDLVFTGVESVLFMNEESNLNGSTNQKLLNLIEGLKGEIMQVTKFADYFDVLSCIDNSIILIYELISSLKNNQDFKEILVKESFVKIEQVLEEIKTLLPKIEELLKDKEGKPNSSNFDYIREGLINCKKHVVLFEEKLTFLKTFQYEDYLFANTMKIDKLNSLQEYLKNLRGEIYPMNEENMEKNANLFKNEFIKGVSDVYKKLVDSREMSEKYLLFIFEKIKKVQTDVISCLDDLIRYQRTLERK
jgi:hypothetical protein